LSNAGRPRLPLRLMVALLYLKHAFNLSDEELCERWSENVVWQFFSGMAYYEPRPPCDATQIGRFRRVLGEAGVEQLLKSTIEASVSMGVVKKSEFERIIVDTTVQEKAIAHPTDSRLLEIARHKVASAAKRCGIALKQTFAKEGKELRRKAGGYAHAKQFRRLRRTIKRQRTILGAHMRDARRGLESISQGVAGDEPTALAITELTMWLGRAERIRTQQRHSKNICVARTRGRMHRQGQGAQALRVRCEGQPGRHAPARLDGRSPVLPRQSVRRAHAGRTTRADQHAAARHRCEAHHGGR
jgi:IS5 family transposase